MKRNSNVLKNTFSIVKKIFRKNTLLSVVALVLTVALMATATYSWVESVSSIVIENKTTTGTSSTTNVLKIEDRLLTKGVVNTASTQPISLAKYIRAAGNVHLSAASSVNGKDIFFPIVQKVGGSSTDTYRKANNNDKNVNYYDFSFKIQLTSGQAPQSFLFSGNGPIFMFNYVENTNIRCSITLDSGTTKLYAKNATAYNGISSTTGATSSVTPKTFSSASINGNKEAIFTINDTSEHIVNVKLWFEGKSTNANVLGKKLTFDNFVLTTNLPTYTVTARACYTDNGTTFTNAATAGGVSLEGDDFYASVSCNVEYNDTAEFYAEQAKAGYKFDGWYTAQTGGTLVSQNTTFETDSITSDKTYYARYRKTYNVTAYAAFSADGSTYTSGSTGGTVSNNNSSFGASTVLAVGVGKSENLYAKQATGYEFVGWYSALNGGTQVGTSTTYATGNVTAAKTVYARFKVKSYTVSAYAYYTTNGGSTYSNGTSGGTVKVGSASASSYSSTTVTHNSSVTFTASAASGYTFEGWYTGSTSGSLVSSNASYTKSSITAATTYYARFKKNVTYQTFYYQNTNNWSNVYAYAYSGSGTELLGGWPGTKMTYVTGTAYTYSIQVPDNATTIVFSNGNSGNGNQTADLSTSGNAGKVYDNSGWKTYNGPTQYVYVGLISYIVNENKVTPSSMQVHHWSDYYVGDTSIGSSYSTRYQAVGSSYWSNAKQKFTMYRVAIPYEATKIKVRQGGTWYGGDTTLSSSKDTVLLFEYGGSFHTYEAKYSNLSTSS